MRLSLSQTLAKKYQIERCYHMTLIQNLPSIVARGELWSYNKIYDQKQAYHSLANEDVQAGRATITIGISGWPLHSYVPLYMGFKTPMVAVNQARNEDIVFLQFRLDILSLGGVVISDGNARSSATKFRLFKQVDDFEFLDISAIRGIKYAKDPELKRKKQAEVLVPDKLSLAHLAYITCYSIAAKKRILATWMGSGIKEPRIQVNPGWYF